MNKEQIYDEQINPLMTQIVEVCKQHGVAMFCTFAIPTEEDADLMCVTHSRDGEGKRDARCGMAHDVVMRGMRFIKNNEGE